MEPLDDSLFIKIQTELFIDPPDPKAEIIADLRDPNNQTVSVKGTLYPFLAISPETRARIITYPFKLDLEEQVHFGSVFSRVIEKLKIGKILEPPTLYQISSTLYYINPFYQFLGGERFGIPIKKDIGISVGFGTPYSGPIETNYVEGNLHILGFKAGLFSHVDAITEIKPSNNHNNIFVSAGYQLGYVIPFGNFLELGFQHVFNDISESKEREYRDDDTLGYQALLMKDSYFNWEFRYPLSLLGSTRARFYAARYLDELHFGFSGREMALAGNVFDFRFDAMTFSKVRQKQYLFEIFVQKIFESWGFSAVAIGPSATFSKTNEGKFGLISVFVNLRLKVGTSL